MPHRLDRARVRELKGSVGVALGRGALASVTLSPSVSSRLSGKYSTLAPASRS
jgi:hypothetical protein